MDPHKEKLHNHSACPDSRWGIARIPIALVLLVAAGVKAARADEIIAMDGLLGSQPFLLSVIAIEAAVAAYILIAPTWWSWLAAIVTFLVLAATATYALATQTSCHCFGGAIGAELTLPLDLITLFAAYVFRPDASSRKLALSTQLVTIPMMSAIGFAGFASFQQTPSDVVHWQDIELLLADQLVGRDWPLTQSEDGELQQLKSGKWLVLVVRRDCDHCKELLNREFADPLRHRVGEDTALFIAGEQSWPVLLRQVALASECDTKLAWPKSQPFVASPAVFCLRDGRVISAADGREAGKFLSELFTTK